MSQLDALEKRLEIKSTDQQMENMTNKDLENASKMFIYMNSCPTPRSNQGLLWFKNWFSFYKNLFQSLPADQIILTLNRMLKASTLENMDGQVRAEKLLKRARSLLSLKFTDIQEILPGRENMNGSVRDQRQNQEISNST